MSIKEEIKSAIGAHGMWKARLRTAIDKGTLDTPVATIKADNQCAFGKWLYGPALSASARNSEHFKKVRELHAEFHAVAGKVAELAGQGKKADAEKLMTTDGPFADVSTRLTREMMAWDKAGS